MICRLFDLMLRHGMFAVRLLGLLALLPAAHARDGVVRTTAGTALAGVVELLPEGIGVTPAGGTQTRVALDQVVELTLTDPGPGLASPTNAVPRDTNRPAATGAPVTDAASGGWSTHIVGPGAEGKFESEGDTWAVTAAGSGLRGNADSLVLVARRMDVSGQISGALTAFGGTNVEAMAGLMLRDNLGESAAYAFVGQRVGSGICFQYRQIASGMTMRVTNAPVALPAWLRLSRLGGSVVAEVSSDGRQWQVFGRANVNLGQSIRAGVVVASGVDGVPSVARFKEPLVGAAGLGYSPTTGYPRVYLRGGSILMVPIDSADESVLRLGGALAGGLVSVLNVARIEYLAPSPELLARIDADRPGLVLTDGDFLDGTLRNITTNVITMNSLLFGFRRFAAGSEAAVVQFGPVEAEDTAFRVLLRQGSELRARTLVPGAGFVRAESPLLGSLVVKAEELQAIRRGGRER